MPKTTETAADAKNALAGLSGYDHIKFLLDSLACAPMAPALVESQADPRNPGRKVYRITGNKQAVQFAIDDLISLAHEYRGRFSAANFVGPFRNCDCCSFVAYGEVVLR